MKTSISYRLRSLMLPGLKRWIVIVLAGILCIVFGVFLLLGYHPITVSGLFIREVMEHAADVLPHRISGIIVITGGAVIVCLAIVRMTVSILGAYLPSDRESIPDVLYRRRHLDRGPKVAVIGGGTGLGNLLKGLKHYTNNITAIVTVGDDGGSSGRLRQELGVLPPGDIRNCITALADDEKLVTELFRYRFGAGDGLEGHSFGNLFLTAVCAITDGDMLEAARVASRILNSCGQVLPSTMSSLNLIAQMKDGRVISGESHISNAGGQIEKVYCEPVRQATPEALSAIAQADLIILGPGSLFTSIIPNLLVGGIAQAILQSKARKLYVANVMTQPGETEGYSVADHLKALLNHSAISNAMAPHLVEAVLVNDQLPMLLENMPTSWVHFDPELIKELSIAVLSRPLVSQEQVNHHDPDKLAKEIMLWFSKNKHELLPSKSTENSTLYQKVASFF